MNIERVESEPLNKALDYLQIEATAYEVHGTLCGVLCGNADVSTQEWVNMMIAEALPEGDLLAEEAVAELGRLYTGTVSAFADNSLDFYPLLPDDEQSSIQLQAIAEWAQGYLLGLGLAGIKRFDDYPSEVAEFVSDITAIARADEYELSGDQSDEETIVELIEFIRIGVLLVNEEMNPLRLPIQIPEDEAYGTLPDDGTWSDDATRH